MTLEVAIKLLTVFGLAAVMLSMGLNVTVEELVASTRNVRQAALLLLANFVLAPAATVGLLLLFAPDPMVSAGFLALAVCPGAPVAPPFASIAKGDAALATGQMAILVLLSAVLSPMLLQALLSQSVSARDVRIDYLAIVRTLLTAQILPLCVGLALRRWAPNVTVRLIKPVSLMANLLLVVVVLALLAKEHQSLATVQLRGWVGMLLLMAASLGIGWFCGGPGRTTRKTLAVTTLVRNVAVALVIASTAFANTAAVTAVIVYGLASIVAALACAFLLAAVPD